MPLNKYRQLIEKINIYNWRIEYDVSIKNQTWFGVGGNIDAVFKPQNQDQLQDFLKNIPVDMKILPIGATSNLLINDNGFSSALVIRMMRFNKLEYDSVNKCIYAGAGVLDINLAKFALHNNVTGMEFLYTIPGNIGGAVAMNAGCYNSQISEVLLGAWGINKLGKLQYFDKEQLNFQYRKCGIKDVIFTEGVFKADSILSNELIWGKMQNFYMKRNQDQPKSVKTGGSTFKNPLSSMLKAWQLIDKVGLRGYKIGDASFSEKHCNFIINHGGASSQNIKDLIDLAIKRVYEECGILLETEIVMLGFE